MRLVVVVTLALVIAVVVIAQFDRDASIAAPRVAAPPKPVDTKELLRSELDSTAPRRSVVHPGPDALGSANFEQPDPLRFPWTLEVVDAVTNQPLDEVTVSYSSGQEASRARHPGGFEGAVQLVESASSPVVVPPPAGLRHWTMASFWVGASGYAFESIRVDFGHAGERRVGLWPAATLDVEIAAIESHPADRVCLYTLRGDRKWPHSSVLVEGRVALTLTDLQPGSFLVQLERGLRHEKPPILVSERVELVSRQVTHVRLQAESTPARLVPMAGTLELADTGRRRPPELRLRRRRSEGWTHAWDASAVELSETPLADTYCWSAGLREPGSYTLSLRYATSFAFDIELPAEGNENILLAVPEMRTVVVELIDEETGLGVVPAHLSWSVRGPIRSGGSTRPEADGTFHLRLHDGLLWTVPMLERHRLANRSVDVASLSAHERWLIRRSTLLLVRVVDGEETVLLWPQRVEIEAIGHAGKWLARRHEDGAERFELDQPGRYRIDVPKVPGFEPLPAQEVEVRLGERTVHRIELIRSR